MPGVYRTDSKLCRNCKFELFFAYCSWQTVASCPAVVVSNLWNFSILGCFSSKALCIFEAYEFLYRYCVRFMVFFLSLLVFLSDYLWRFDVATPSLVFKPRYVGIFVLQRAKPTNKRPVEHIVLETRRKDELREQFLADTKYQKQCDLKVGQFIPSSS